MDRSAQPDARPFDGTKGGRIVSVSGAPYDGHAMPAVFESLARLGVRHVEPAFIVGYTEPFDETAFLPARILECRAELGQSGLSCHALSTHIDLGLPDAVEVFTNRMAFAAGIGARIVCTNASARTRETAFERNLETLLRRAEGFDLVIALENPGDGSDNLLNTAADAPALIRRFASPRLGLNYDAANTASHRPDFGDFAADAIEALPLSVHAHIKDVARTPQGWFFAPLGEGDIDCRRICEALGDHPRLPISIELPLRLHRDAAARPVRAANPLPLAVIEDALARSLRAVTSWLPGDGRAAN